MSIEVGKAYVSIIPSTRGFGPALNREMSGIGRGAGASLSSGISSTLGSAIRTATRVSVVTAGIGAAAGGAAWSIGMIAARTQVMGVAFGVAGKIAGYTQKQLDKNVTSMKALGITTQDSYGISSLFIQNNLKLADSLKIARVAQDLAVMAGMNSSEAAKTLTEAISSQQPMLLRQFGIVTDLNVLYLGYGRQLGIVHDKTLKTGAVQHIWTRQLTETEKKQSFLNVIMAQGTKVASTYEKSMGYVGKQWTSFPRYLQEAANSVGKFFLPAMGGALDWAHKALAGIQETFDKAPSFAVGMKRAIAAALAAIPKMMGDAFGPKTQSIVEDLLSQMHNLAVSIGEVGDSLNDISTTLGGPKGIAAFGYWAVKTITFITRVGNAVAGLAQIFLGATKVTGGFIAFSIAAMTGNLSGLDKATKLGAAGMNLIVGGAGKVATAFKAATPPVKGMGQAVYDTTGKLIGFNRTPAANKRPNSTFIPLAAAAHEATRQVGLWTAAKAGNKTPKTNFASIAKQINAGTAAVRAWNAVTAKIGTLTPLHGDTNPGPGQLGKVGTGLSTAYSEVGKPYVWGASGPNAFDCSGLVSYILNSMGFHYGRMTTSDIASSMLPGRGNAVTVGLNPGKHTGISVMGKWFEAKGHNYPVLGPGEARTNWPTYWHPPGFRYGGRIDGPQSGYMAGPFHGPEIVTPEAASPSGATNTFTGCDFHFHSAAAVDRFLDRTELRSELGALGVAY